MTRTNPIATPRRPHVRARGLAALATALLLAGCHAGPEATTPPAAGNSPHAIALPRIDSTAWRCTRLVDADGNSVAATEHPPTLEISPDGRASGFAGVNRYSAEATFGSVTMPPEPLRFGPVIATRMAGPPERMELERAFVSMLATVRSARVTAGDHGPTLILASDRGECAWFEPVPSAQSTE